MSATFPFSPAAFNASSSFGMLFFAGTVLTEIAIMSALLSFALSTKTCGAILLPASTVLNPALFSAFLTCSLAVSCMSGSMLPITTVPIGFAGSGGSFSIIALRNDISTPILVQRFLPCAFYTRISYLNFNFTTLLFKNEGLGRQEMFKVPNKYLMLFLVLIFSFTYRMLLMHWQTFPPGADIGLHNSVIHSITESGNTNFLWNNYQMGGGTSLTFPGYHIFLSYIISITGLPEYLAHSLVVAFFSSLIALCAFLITRTIWHESAALIVAFLVAISRFDVEMLLWGGYPNVITLMLIPLTFYLFLQKAKFSLGPFLASTALLSGAIFLTHSLSSAIFVGITVAAVVIVAIFSKRIGVPRTRLFIWFVPLLLGVVIVSPFLLKIVPAYLSASGDIFSGGMNAIRLALLSTRVLPLDLVLPLLVLFPLFFLFSKKHFKSFFTVPAVLLAVWILIPTILTQGFLVGFYTDYNRFLYFVVLPVIILIGIAIDHGSHFFSRVIDTYRTLTKCNSPPKNGGHNRLSRLTRHVTRKNLYSLFIVGFLLFSFLAVPIFLTPWRGAEISSFYQTMSPSGYEAMQWAKQNTPVGSIFVSDAYYGWWFSGFAQRPTFSAVDPQYLTLTREFKPATIAKSLLDTDYIIDNGLIQVREDGGYISRHNPMFLAKLNWTYFPYDFFNFNDGETTVLLRVGDDVKSFDLTQLAVKEMRSENSTDQAYILVKKGNNFFNYTQCITVFKGVGFVNMSIVVESDEDVYLDWIDFIIHIKGEPILGSNTVGLFDNGVKALGQLIFAEKQPDVSVITPENPSGLKLQYNLEGKSNQEIQLFVGAFSVTDDQNTYRDPAAKASFLNGLLVNNVNFYLKDGEPTPIESLPLEVFDYQKAIRDNEISYIACRDSSVIPKFANDPAFNLVFINDEVAIFMVKQSFNQQGG